MTESDNQWVLKDGFWNPGLDPPSLTVQSALNKSSIQRRSLSMISQAATEDESENDDTLDYSLFNIKPKSSKTTNLLSSHMSASACDITEAFNPSVCTGSQFQQRFRSRSSSVVSSIHSSMALSNYATPVDIKRTKTRTQSFSPGSANSPTVIKGKYRLSNHSFRARPSSVSTVSSSSSSSVPSTTPLINTESTEQFWNQYRRQTNSSFIGKLLKRALSKQQVYCVAPKYISPPDSVAEDSNSSENEDLYDEMYSDMFQGTFQLQTTASKKTTRNCQKKTNYTSMAEMIL